MKTKVVKQSKPGASSAGAIIKRLNYEVGLFCGVIGAFAGFCGLITAIGLCCIGLLLSDSELYPLALNSVVIAAGGVVWLCVGFELRRLGPEHLLQGK